MSALNSFFYIYKDDEEAACAKRGAKILQEELKKLGVPVIACFDQEAIDLQEGLNKAVEKLGDEGILLIYYAGHGLIRPAQVPGTNSGDMLNYVELTSLPDAHLLQPQLWQAMNAKGRCMCLTFSLRLHLLSNFF